MSGNLPPIQKTLQTTDADGWNSVTLPGQNNPPAATSPAVQMSSKPESPMRTTKLHSAKSRTSGSVTAQFLAESCKVMHTFVSKDRPDGTAPMSINTMSSVVSQRVPTCGWDDVAVWLKSPEPSETEQTIDNGSPGGARKSSVSKSEEMQFLASEIRKKSSVVAIDMNLFTPEQVTAAKSVCKEADSFIYRLALLLDDEDFEVIGTKRFKIKRLETLMTVKDRQNGQITGYNLSSREAEPSADASQSQIPDQQQAIRTPSPLKDDDDADDNNSPTQAREEILKVRNSEGQAQLFPHLANQRQSDTVASFDMPQTSRNATEELNNNFSDSEDEGSGDEIKLPKAAEIAKKFKFKIIFDPDSKAIAWHYKKRMENMYDTASVNLSRRGSIPLFRPPFFESFEEVVVVCNSLFSMKVGIVAGVLGAGNPKSFISNFPGLASGMVHFVELRRDKDLLRRAIKVDKIVPLDASLRQMRSTDTFETMDAQDPKTKISVNGSPSPGSRIFLQSSASENREATEEAVFETSKSKKAICVLIALWFFTSMRLREMTELMSSNYSTSDRSIADQVAMYLGMTLTTARAEWAIFFKEMQAFVVPILDTWEGIDGLIQILKWMSGYLWKHRRYHLFWALLSVFYNSAYAVARPLLIALVFEEADQQNLDDVNYIYLASITATVFILALGRVMSTWKYNCEVPSGNNCTVVFRAFIASTVLSFPTVELEALENAKLMAILETDTGEVGNAFNAYFEGLGNILLLMSVFAFLFALSWTQTLAVLFWVPVFWQAQKKRGKTLTDAATNFRSQEKEQLSMIESHFVTATLTSSCGMRGTAARLIHNEANDLQDCAFDVDVSYANNFMYLDFVNLGLEFTVIMLGAYLVVLGEHTMPEFLAYYIASQSVTDWLASIAGSLSQFHLSRASLNSMISILKHDLKFSESPPTEFNDCLVLKDVTISFPHSMGGLFNVNLKIKHGDKVGLVGHSGAGKSVLLKAIGKLYQATEGEVRYDGVKDGDVSEIVAFMEQDPLLPHGTVFESISYLLDVTQDEVQATCEETGLWPIIQRLPEGLNTHVGPESKMLSTGQRQLLAFTRLLLRNRPVLIMDEPVSGLDGLATSTVNRILREGTCNGAPYTVIASSHNLALFENFDTIVVLNQGHIVDVSSPKELEKGDTEYSSMVAMQKGISADPDGHVRVTWERLRHIWSLVSCNLTELEYISRLLVYRDLSPGETLLSGPCHSHFMAIVCSGGLCARMNSPPEEPTTETLSPSPAKENHALRRKSLGMDNGKSKFMSSRKPKQRGESRKSSVVNTSSKRTSVSSSRTSSIADPGDVYSVGACLFETIVHGGNTMFVKHLSANNPSRVALLHSEPFNLVKSLVPSIEENVQKVKRNKEQAENLSNLANKWVLKGAQPSLLAEFVNNMEPEVIMEGTSVYNTKGSLGRAFYILLHGQVKVTTKLENSISDTFIAACDANNADDHQKCMDAYLDEIDGKQEIDSSQSRILEELETIGDFVLGDDRDPSLISVETMTDCAVLGISRDKISNLKQKNELLRQIIFDNTTNRKLESSAEFQKSVLQRLGIAWRKMHLTPPYRPRMKDLLEIGVFSVQRELNYLETMTSNKSYVELVESITKFKELTKAKEKFEEMKKDKSRLTSRNFKESDPKALKEEEKLRNLTVRELPMHRPKCLKILDSFLNKERTRLKKLGVDNPFTALHNLETGQSSTSTDESISLGGKENSQQTLLHKKISGFIDTLETTLSTDFDIKIAKGTNGSRALQSYIPMTHDGDHYEAIREQLKESIEQYEMEKASKKGKTKQVGKDAIANVFATTLQSKLSKGSSNKTDRSSKKSLAQAAKKLMKKKNAADTSSHAEESEGNDTSNMSVRSTPSSTDAKAINVPIQHRTDPGSLQPTQHDKPDAGSNDLKPVNTVHVAQTQGRASHVQETANTDNADSNLEHADQKLFSSSPTWPDRTNSMSSTADDTSLRETVGVSSSAIEENTNATSSQVRFSNQEDLQSIASEDSQTEMSVLPPLPEEALDALNSVSNLDIYGNGKGDAQDSQNDPLPPSGSGPRPPSAHVAGNVHRPRVRPRPKRS